MNNLMGLNNIIQDFPSFNITRLFPRYQRRKTRFESVGQDLENYFVNNIA